jgi:hypothetical protein
MATRPNRLPLALQLPGKILLTLAPLATAVCMAGCSTSKPFSYLDSERWSRVEMNTYDTTIVSVDGTSYPYRSRIVVDPGRHHIVFQTKAAAGFESSPQKSLDLDVEPCVRYWFEAKRANPLQQDFELRINHTEPIAGCGTASTSRPMS